MIMLLVAAIGALVAGVLAILYGIPVKEFSFGNTLVLAGVIGICTGLILFGLWVATREMRAIARRIATPASAGLHDPSLPELSAAPARPAMPARSPMREPAMVPSSAAAAPAPPAFPQNEIEDRAPPPELEPMPVAAPVPEPPPKPRRNLLFESSVRKDRDKDRETDRARATATDAPSAEPPKRAVFEDPIAQRGADRADRLQRIRSPSTFADAPAPIVPNAPAPIVPDVTVLKSGVVDGMSYSLYSDGSIEAQMPEGIMRFTSIEELRHHLDQRGA